MIEGEIKIQLDDVKAVYGRVNNLVPVSNAVDANNNPVEAFQIVSQWGAPVVTLTLNGIDVDLKDLDVHIQKESTGLPFTRMNIGYGMNPHYLGISFVAYSMDQFTVMMNFISPILDEEFKQHITW